MDLGDGDQGDEHMAEQHAAGNGSGKATKGMRNVDSGIVVAGMIELLECILLQLLAKDLVIAIMKGAMKQPKVKAMMAKIKAKIDHSNEQQVFKSAYNAFVTLASIFIKASTDEKLSITQMSSIWSNIPPALKADLIQRLDAVRAKQAELKSAGGPPVKAEAIWEQLEAECDKPAFDWGPLIAIKDLPKKEAPPKPPTKRQREEMEAAAAAQQAAAAAAAAAADDMDEDEEDDEEEEEEEVPQPPVKRVAVAAPAAAAELTAPAEAATTGRKHKEEGGERSSHKKHKKDKKEKSEKKHKKDKKKHKQDS